MRPTWGAQFFVHIERKDDLLGDLCSELMEPIRDVALYRTQFQDFFKLSIEPEILSQYPFVFTFKSKKE